jgi:glycosyltransferase involved in cell wall biosynthesis
LLHVYEIAIYSASQEVKIAAEIFSESTGIPVTIIPHGTKHLNILRLHGQARISIGLSIGDAISTSFLEALVMGSFPIQSNTSSCDEWIEDGKTSFIVPPEDPDVIENAIRKSLTDDNLVDKAAEINYETAKEKLDYSLLKAKAIEMYETVAAQSGVFSKIA